MKRRNFIKGVGLGTAALASATVAKSFASTTNVAMDEFEHDPADWALVPEEPEEFQELEIDVPGDWAEKDIIWA